MTKCIAHAVTVSFKHFCNLDHFRYSCILNTGKPEFKIRLCFDDVGTKKENGVYVLPFYSVEAIYFHPKTIKCIAERMGEVKGYDPNNLTCDALNAGICAITDHTERLSRNITKKSIRKLVLAQIPNDDELLKGESVLLNNDAISRLEECKKELDVAVENKNWETILSKCPLRRSDAMNRISKALGFFKVSEYEQAIRKLLEDDSDVLKFVRDLFEDMSEQLNA